MPPGGLDVGRRLRELRSVRGFSLRALADLSGLNINTLSLIENGKTSPCVNTLQQLAAALQVPIKYFFETQPPRDNTAYQKAGRRPRTLFCQGVLEDLGAEMILNGEQPLLLTLEPKATLGQSPVAHSGLEFIYCLEGRLMYTVDEQEYQLNPGDSLLFEARLPHCGQNVGDTTSRALLVMCPTGEDAYPAGRHFEPG